MQTYMLSTLGHRPHKVGDGDLNQINCDRRAETQRSGINSTVADV